MMYFAYSLFSIMNTHKLFRRSRTRLALWYAVFMGVILSLFGLGMYRALDRKSVV